MRLPTYDELASVEEQLQVLERPLDRSLFVAGPPGSGKTVLALQRAQMLAESQSEVIGAFPPRPPQPPHLGHLHDWRGARRWWRRTRNRFRS